MKPCPFCGGDRIAVLMPAREEYVGCCLDCCAYGPPTVSDSDARTAWNRRAGQPSDEKQEELFT